MKRVDSYYPKSYNYAMKFLCACLADDVNDGRRPYCQLVAGLLRDMGVLKCQMGEMAAGCQLLHESAGLYQWIPRNDTVELTIQDVIKIAEVGYLALGELSLASLLGR